LFEYFTKKKAKANIKHKHKKLNLTNRIKEIDPDIKQRVIELYMVRQKFYYTIRFLYWLAIYRGEHFDEDSVSILLTNLFNLFSHQIQEMYD